MTKTSGLVEPLRAALTPLAERIEVDFGFGSVAKGSDRAGSDIDLLVISDDLSYQEVYPALEPAEAALARRIDPTVLTRAEWHRKTARDDSFAARVLDHPKLFMIGSEDALA